MQTILKWLRWLLGMETPYEKFARTYGPYLWGRARRPAIYYETALDYVDNQQESDT